MLQKNKVQIDFTQEIIFYVLFKRFAFPKLSYRGQEDGVVKTSKSVFLDDKEMARGRLTQKQDILALHKNEQTDSLDWKKKLSF